MKFSKQVVMGLALLAGSALARDLGVDWQQGLPPDTTVLMNVGDRLVFQWPEGSAHNVWQLGDLQAMENCQFPSDGLGFLGGISGVVWEAQSTGSFFFSSSEGTDCSSGNMKINAIVVDADSPPPTVAPPAPTAAPGGPSPAPTSGVPAPTSGSPAPGPSPAPTQRQQELPICSAKERNIYLACVNSLAQDESSCLGVADLGGALYGCSWCSGGEGAVVGVNGQGCFADINCRFEVTQETGAAEEDEENKEEEEENKEEEEEENKEEEDDGSNPPPQYVDVRAKTQCSAEGGSWVAGEFTGTSPAAGAFELPGVPLTLGAVALTLLALF